MKTGKIIKELRIKKGMTQEELADKTELSTRTIQRIENGEVDPRSYTLQMIAKALEVEFNILMVDETTEENLRSNDNIWLGLMYLGGLLPLIFPSAIIWKLKKNIITGMGEQFRTVLSFQLIALGMIFGSLWVYWKVNIPTPLLIVLIGNALFTIMNTLRVLNGEDHMHPFFMKKRDNPNN